MRVLIPGIVVGIFLCGCSAKPEPQPSVMNTAPATAAQDGSANNSGNIAPIGPNVGGITPVAGGEDLGGGTGGGLAQAAKKAAHNAADQSSATTGEAGSE